MLAPSVKGTDQSASAVTVVEIQQWRLKVLDGMLYTVFAVAGPYMTIFLVGAFETMPERAGAITVGFALMYVVIAVTTFVRSMPYLARTVILLATFYALAIFDIFLYGLGSDGRIYGLSLVIIAALLLGIRSATAVAVLTVASLVALGGLVHHWVPDTVPPQPDVMFWAIQIASQAIHSIVLLVCIAFLLRRLVDALGSSRAALQHAEASAEEARRQSAALATQTRLLEDAREKLQDLVASLETPAVDLADRIVLAPLTGVLDARRADALTERLLRKVHDAGTRLVILDLAGMPAADAASIQALKTTVQALGLLGCRVAFTGVSAALTPVFVEASMREGDVTFRRSPQEVLELGESHVT